MAVREIRTRLTLDNTKQFEKEVSEAGRSMRVMASDMKVAASEFEATGDEMAFLGRKSQILKNQIEQQEEIIRALSEAVEASAEAFDDASGKTDGYRIKLNNAKATMNKLRKELEDTDSEMRGLGQDAGRVGRQLEQGLGEAAEDTGKKFDRMVRQLDQDLIDIKGAVEFSAFKDTFDLVTGSVTGAYNALAGLTEGTVDYRRQMSFLESNAFMSGMDFQTIKDMTFSVSGLTGELDSAIEGMSNLMAAGFEEDELALAVERLKAAVIRFPDTLKFESLADSLQESVATEKAVGQYAEYLERMGLDLDEVNKSFEEAAKLGPEAVETVALAWLNNEDAEAMLERHERINKDLIEGQEAQERWNDEVSRTAGLVQPVVTAMTDLKTKTLGIVNDFLTETDLVHKTLQGIADIGPSIIEYREERDKNRREKAADTPLGKAVTWWGNLWIPEEETEKALDNVLNETATQGIREDAGTLGEDLGTQIGDGVAEKESYITTQIGQVLTQAQAELDRRPLTVRFNAATGELLETAGSASQAGTMAAQFDLVMDGKKLGEGMADYSSKSLGKSVETAEMYVY